MIIGRLAVVAAVVLAGACDTPCAFRIVTRLELDARRVACCGAADVQDIVLPDQPDLAIDISQVALPNRAGGQDLWLTKTDCEQLFDGPYAEPGTGPRPMPKCQVLAGPVSPGRVSPRTPLAPGAIQGVRAGVFRPTPPPTTIASTSVSGARRAMHRR